MNTKIVTFAKPHLYAGQPYEAGEKLELPEARAKMLEAQGVLETKSKKKDAD